MVNEYKSVIQMRIEMLEKEIEDLKRKLDAPLPAEPVTNLRGMWAGVDITDEDIEEITHPQRVIDRLRAENEALRRELEKYQNTKPPTSKAQA